MKHTVNVTLVLGALFLCAHLIGLFVVGQYLGTEEGTWEELPYGIERPQFEEETSYLPLFGILLIATALILVLMKFQLFRLWKVWFFLSVWFCLTISVAVFVGEQYAYLLAGVFAFGKVLWKNTYVHNFTELFIYGGLAAVFVPFLSLMGISILLVVISIYDMIAVWKTKHMVGMAKFQTKVKLFAGLLVPYGKKHAILGGGDIGFPLFFSGVVLKLFGWMDAVIVSVFTTIALLVLLFKSEKNKYYPAMPFLSAGCFLGLLVIWLI